MQSWLQRTCLEILKKFTKEGIDFAFPSQSVYLAGDNKRQLALKMLEGERCDPLERDPTGKNSRR